MFSRLDRLVTTCKQHLIDSNSQGTQIELILVGHILTVIYAEFETVIRSSIKERCVVGTDPQVSSFMQHAVDRIVRSIKVSELSGILGLFSLIYKQDFQRDMKHDNGIAEVYYHNLVSNRQAIAHNAFTNATMRDVEEWLPSGKAVIEAFRRALGLTSSQVT